MGRMCIPQKIQQRLQRGLQGQGNGGCTDKDLALHMSQISILVNVAFTIGKLSAGVLAHFNAMTSDAVHSASGMSNTLIVMIGVTMTAKQSDKEHPFGHERMECVTVLFLTVVFLATGAGIGSGAVRAVSWNHGTAAVPGFLVTAAALVSIGTKEWMHRYTKRAASEIRSCVLMADTWHHYSDTLPSVGALVGIGGARLGIPLMDPAASLVICIFIGKAALDVLRDSLNQMVNKTCDDGTSDSIRMAALRSDGVEWVDGLKTRLFGPKVYVETKVAVDRNMKLEQIHHIAKNVRDAAKEGFPQVKHYLVQANPLSREEGKERLVWRVRKNYLYLAMGNMVKEEIG